MDEDTLRKQLYEKLNNIKSCKKIVFFARLCAIRALPYIGAAGRIEFSGEKNTDKNLYAIFNIIDIAVGFFLSYIDLDTARTDTLVLNTTLLDDVINFTTNSVRTDAYDAVIKTVSCILTAYDDDFTKATNAAVNAAVFATHAASVVSVRKQIINLYNIILEDISYIDNGTLDKINNDLNLYGDVWNNFQKALNDIGCGYWAILYKRIFEQGFNKLNKKALRMRMDVPLEIKEQGAKTVADYLEQLESEEKKKLNEARIIILGEKGAGKTCLARRLIKPDAPMLKPDESTEGVVSTTWKIEGKDDLSIINAHIWDFAGHVITHAVHRCFLSERCLYILVYDGRTERRNQLEYWLDHVRNYGGDAPVFILINKFDTNHPDIPENTLKRKYPFIQDFFYFSIAKDKDDLATFRAKTSEFIRNNPVWNTLKIPSSHYKVKNALINLFDDNIEFITKNHFYVIARKNGVTSIEEQNSLLDSLHILGICLWYKDIEGFDMLILNPDWITNGIYKIINWAYNQKPSKHTISLEDYEEIFKDEKKRYPKDKFMHIFKLMREYELAYSTNKDNIKITVPHLLREDQPASLPDFPIEDSLMIKYVSEQALPPNTVCRLIVRHHGEIRSDNEVWRYGVVLEDKKGATALVYENDRNIEITVKGNNKSEYISKLRETMNDIFNSYKSKKPELQYRLFVIGDYSINNKYKPVMLHDEIINSLINNNHDKYFDPLSNKNFLLKPIIQAYRYGLEKGISSIGQLFPDTDSYSEHLHLNSPSNVIANSFRQTDKNLRQAIKENSNAKEK